MYIKTLPLDDNHWSTQWVPISYSLKPYAVSKSCTFLYHISNIEEVNAICRAYYISPTVIELGDIWLNEQYRGKYIPNKPTVKYSHEFMTKVITKIWHLYPTVKTITLRVASDNIPAIKLYKSMHFTFPTSKASPNTPHSKNTHSKNTHSNNTTFLTMIRHKHHNTN